MAELSLRVNGSDKKVNVSPDTPLLWVLRDSLQLTGTKYGCGAGLCGACMGMSMEPRPAPASPPSRKLQESRSRRLKAFQQTVLIRCNRRGSPKKFLNAAIARADRSWRPLPCSRRLLSLQKTKSPE